MTPFQSLHRLRSAVLRSASTRARVCAALLASTLAASASVLPAQLVGADPSRSPFRDLPTSQQLTLSGGLLKTANDAADLGPDAAPYFELRHDLHLAGPAWMTTRYGLMRSERRVIDPGLPAGERYQGQQSVTQHFADLGLTLALTGQKSWHQVVPTLGAGIGMTSDFSDLDIGGYKFGSKFAFTFGPGLRVALPGGYSLRADVTNRVYQFQYPSTFFAAASDSTKVLTDTKQRSGWLSNWSFTTGVSIPIFR